MLKSFNLETELAYAHALARMHIHTEQEGDREFNTIYHDLLNT